MPNLHGTHYTTALGEAIAAAMKRTRGAFFPACDLVGINRRTARGWLDRGRSGQQPYDEFAAVVGIARAEAMEKLLGIAEDDKGGAAFLLERIFPADLGQNTRGMQGAMEMLLDQVMPMLTPGAQRELVDAIANIGRDRTGESGVADAEASGDGAIEAEGELVGTRRLESGTE